MQYCHRSLKIIVILILCLIGFVGCEKLFYPIGGGDIIYFKSIESMRDLSDWDEVGAASIKEDAPPNGGRYSLQIAGGCIVPHAYVDLKPLSEQCRLRLRFWGKNLTNSGQVVLGAGNFGDGTSVSVDEKDWRYYESPIINGKKNQVLRLNLLSGGYVPSAMLIDLIEIVKVE